MRPRGSGRSQPYPRQPVFAPPGILVRWPLAYAPHSAFPDNDDPYPSTPTRGAAKWRKHTGPSRSARTSIRRGTGRPSRFPAPRTPPFSMRPGRPSMPVTASTSEIANSLQMASTATLDINAGTTFTATAGSATGALAGAVVVEDGGSLAIGGAFANSGSVTLDSVGTGNGTSLIISKSATLSGGGQITLTDWPYNQIAAGASNATLTNVDNTISGSGLVGSANLTLFNQAAGVIDATGGNILSLNTGAHTITNVGHGWHYRESGDSHWRPSAVANGGGTLLAGAGSSLTLQAATVSGGLVKSAGSGQIVSQGATFDGTGGALTSQGLVTVADGQFLAIEGSIVNQGTFALDSVGTGNGTSLVIAKSTTLSGSGASAAHRLALQPDPWLAPRMPLSTGAAGQYDLRWGWIIGSTTLTLVNQVAGVINATGANRPDVEHRRSYHRQRRVDREHRERRAHAPERLVEHGEPRGARLGRPGRPERVGQQHRRHGERRRRGPSEPPDRNDQWRRAEHSRRRASYSRLGDQRPGRGDLFERRDDRHRGRRLARPHRFDVGRGYRCDRPGRASEQATVRIWWSPAWSPWRGAVAWSLCPDQSLRRHPRRCGRRLDAHQCEQHDLGGRDDRLGDPHPGESEPHRRYGAERFDPGHWRGHHRQHGHNGGHRRRRSSASEQRGQRRRRNSRGRRRRRQLGEHDHLAGTLGGAGQILAVGAATFDEVATGSSPPPGPTSSRKMAKP